MSRWSDVISLTGITEGTDLDGFPADVEVTRENIFANKLPVRSTEFYQASQTGYKIEARFKIRLIDYQGEEKLSYEGIPYTIERTYETGEFVELSCERRDDSHV